MFFRQNKSTLQSMSEKSFYEAQVAKCDQVVIEKLFARLFSTEDGQKALAYLQHITFKRAMGPSLPNEQLRYLEGQRSIVATILKLIERGCAG